MRAHFALALLVVACGSSASEPAISTPPPSTCTAAYDIRSTPGVVYEDPATDAVSRWPVEGASFTVTMRRDGDAARIIGTLANATDHEIAIDWLTGGVVGLSMNPFDVTVEGTPERTAQGPEIYPAPRRVRIPAGGSVTFDLTQCPSTFPSRVRWIFSPFSGDAVRGDDTIR